MVIKESNRAKQRQYLRGFTLIEVLVVVVILALLASFIVPRILDRPDQARIVKVNQDLRMLESSLALYRLDNFRYPTSQQGLQALLTKPDRDPLPKHWYQPYIQRLPKDPWGENYQYIYPGEHGEFDVFSLGSDGLPGGEGYAADIGNWQLQ